MVRKSHVLALLSLSVIALIAIGCRSAKFEFDPLDMIFPDNRPLHEQYPPSTPVR